MDNVGAVPTLWWHGRVMTAELAEALEHAGVRLAGPLGRTSDGLRWSVLDDAGHRWTMVVRDHPPSTEVDEQVRRRHAAVSGVEHPHLACPGPVLDLGSCGAVVLQEEVDGVDLATVRAARGRWSPGEVVTVVVPLAQALAALHGAGLTHGRVAMASVTVTWGGLPVLVDAVHDADPPHHDAPDRSGPGADVAALIRLGRDLVEACEPGAERDRVLEALPLPGPDGTTPGATALAEQLYLACEPTPIVLPEPAVLTRHALQRVTEREPVRSTVARRRGRHRGSATGPGRVLAAVAASTVGAVIVTAALLTGLGPGAADPGTGQLDPGSGTGAAAAPAERPEAAAIRLTATRAHALAAQDDSALASVTVPGSPAADADREALTRVRAAGHGVLSALVEVASVRRCVPADQGVTERRRCPHCPRVQVQARSVGSDSPGSPDASVTAHSHVVLVLDRSAGGWRVSAVEQACP